MTNMFYCSGGVRPRNRMDPENHTPYVFHLDRRELHNMNALTINRTIYFSC